MDLKTIEAKKKGFGLSSVQNSIAKFLYIHLDGAYSKKISSTGAEVRSTILYQIPHEIQRKYDLDESYSKVDDIDVTIQITTYADKIRVNIIEITPEEKTIGHKTFKADTFDNVQFGINIVYDFIRTKIIEEFEDYEILF